MNFQKELDIAWGEGECSSKEKKIQKYIWVHSNTYLDVPKEVILIGDRRDILTDGIS